MKKIEEMNIYEKMSSIALEVGVVAKNLSIETGGKKSYKAVSEVDVLNAVKPVEAKYRVFSYPIVRRIVDSGEFVTVSEYKGEKKERKQLFLRLKTDYCFVNMDNPSEFITITAFGDGLDSGDKATGKAMTYADKYALLKAYKIMTGDDPDQYASEELISSNVGNQKIDATKIKVLDYRCKESKIDNIKLLKKLNVSSFAEVTEEQFAFLAKNWEKVAKECS